MTGQTASTDFPTQSPYQTQVSGIDIFVMKLSAPGKSLVYSTYLGGGRADWGQGVALDCLDFAYVLGATGSYDFRTENPYQIFQGEKDALL